MKRLILFAVILLQEEIRAQSVSTLMGARPAGMGYASVVIQDESSLFNNVGAMAEVSKLSSFFACEASPALPGSSRVAAGILVPSKVGVFGAGLFRFGDDVYREQVITAGFSNRLGLASLGVGLQYCQYQAETYGTKGTFSINFGGRAQITPNISFGAFLSNLSQAELSPGEPLPVKLTAGIGFKPDERFFIVTQVDKDLAYRATWKTGAEYAIHKKVYVRSGYNHNPNAAFFGIGFKGTRLKADYALGFNSAIGSNHQASAVYQLVTGKKEK